MQTLHFKFKDVYWIIKFQSSLVFRFRSWLGTISGANICDIWERRIWRTSVHDQRDSCQGMFFIILGQCFIAVYNITYFRHVKGLGPLFGIAFKTNSKLFLWVGLYKIKHSDKHVALVHNFFCDIMGLGTTNFENHWFIQWFVEG